VAAELITSALLLCPHPQACTTNGRDSLDADPSVPEDAEFSALLSSGFLLFTSVSLRRALILGQEALVKNVRFRGWVGDPRTVLGEEKTDAH